MDEDELARIRDQRMAQLQSQSGSQQAASGDQVENQKQQQEAQKREADMRRNILSSVLTQGARARLSTLAAAKPDRAQMVENIIIQNTRMGGIRGKVDENSLISLLERVNDQTRRETKVSYERRRVFDDDDEDD